MDWEGVDESKRYTESETKGPAREKISNHQYHSLHTLMLNGFGEKNVRLRGKDSGFKAGHIGFKCL